MTELDIGLHFVRLSRRLRHPAFNGTSGNLLELSDGSELYLDRSERLYVDVAAVLEAQGDPQSFADFLRTLRAASEELSEALELAAAEEQRQSPAADPLPSPPRKPVQGTVYFFRNAHGHVKIGSTTGKAQERLKTLQTGSSSALELVHSFNSSDCRGAELALHKLFGSKRLHGEWFDLSAADVEQFRRVI